MEVCRRQNKGENRRGNGAIGITCGCTSAHSEEGSHFDQEYAFFAKSNNFGTRLDDGRPTKASLLDHIGSATSGAEGSP
jgi:hypothetical protein